ncbi:MAG: amidohydrolase [Pseudomonadota bacterium]
MRILRTSAVTIALAVAGLSAPIAAESSETSTTNASNASVTAVSNAATMAAITSAVEADYDAYLAPLFVHFHENPELSFLENKTAERMAAELRATGLEVTENVGGTGVVGLVKNGEGPLILLRADMDGLPVKEKSGLEYASTVTQVGQDGKEYPVMHACGHDVHITSMVGTARQLMAMKDKWSGTLMFIVQPAEERVGGAKAMLADGLYERFGKPDYALAFHVASVLPTGKVSAAEGIQYSSSDSVDVTVPGIGAHGASPHMGRDPVYIASQIVTALQSIVSREIGPLSPAVITVGSFQAGSKHNIISDEARLQLTVRSNDEKVRAQLLDAIQRVATNVGKAHGLPEDLPVKVEVIEGTPVTYNDPKLARRLNNVMKRDLGEDTFQTFRQQGMGAEDFAYFVAEELDVPGYYFAVGGTPQAAFDAHAEGGPRVPSHHSPLFKIAPRESVTLGTRAMIAAVLDLAPSS